jgi:hypothetical protein
MTAGLHAVNYVNKCLNVLSGTTFTATANTYAELHTGDPGSAGTSNASSVTTRVILAWSAASAGSKAITATLPAWTAWAGTNNEVVTHIAVWDALTSGNFLYSYALTASKTVGTGDTLTLTSHSISFTPLAA